MTTTYIERTQAERTTDQLLEAARRSGLTLRDRSQGEYELKWKSKRGCILKVGSGWMTATAQRKASGESSGLSIHAHWPGPARCDSNGANLTRLELPIDGTGLFGADQWLLCADDSSEIEFLQGLLARFPAWMEARAIDDWEPPEASQLTEWLGEAGHTSAIDEQGSLRAVLKRRGCDGQVLIERETGRLRLTMRIGAWTTIPEPTRDAMRSLVQVANHRTRMVRLAWLTDEEANKVRCEAQLDLTGLPLPAEGNTVSSGLWSTVLAAGLDGFQLHLDRLGLELGALADPDNSDVVEVLNEALRE